MGKKLLLLLSVIGLIALLAACSEDGSANEEGENGATEDEEVYTIRYAHNQLEETPQAEGTVLFKEKVEELSEGRIKVDIYPNSQLGSLREVIESVQSGQIELAQQPLGMLSNFAPVLALNDLPYLYPSEDILWKVLDGELGDVYHDALAEQGFVGLGYMSGGPKQFSAHKALRTTEDFAGVQIRAMEAPIVISTMEALGASPIPIAFSELYNSLQQGVVDGQENPNQTVDMLNLYEVQDVVTLTNHSWMIYNNVMNKEYFESLPEDLQADVREAMDYANTEQRKIMQEAETTYVESIESNGTEVVELTDEEVQGLKDATSKVYDEFEDEIGAELIQRFKDKIQELEQE